MAWYDEAVFYHIYPLGLLDAPKENDYGEPVHRLRHLSPWIDHVREIGCNAIYIGPLFESVGHGYETTDYKKLDSRLGDNEDLKAFVKECHEKGIRVIFDGVFNHTGRDFFAFKDLQANREQSRYKDWYCNVNFWNNNSYNDGFSYENWGGYDLLVKLNQRHPEVQGYIADVIRYWVSEFDVDGIRLDAADVLDFDFMAMLRRVANEVKPDFYLMGEVIHGEYNRWVNPEHLHAVTNYALNKALWSGMNEHNNFEIAHTVRRLYGMGGNRPDGLKLYNFSDNHDVARIMSKLHNKAHYVPVQVLVYTLPGVPSVYYGSEFGIEGEKQRGSDANLRPALHLEDFKDEVETNPCTRTVAILGRTRQAEPALSYGDYRELLLTNRQYAYVRDLNGEQALSAVNNDDNDAWLDLPVNTGESYYGVLTGETYSADNGRIHVRVPANGGDVYILLSHKDRLSASENVMPVESVAASSDTEEISESLSNADEVLERAEEELQAVDEELEQVGEELQSAENASEQASEAVESAEAASEETCEETQNAEEKAASLSEQIAASFETKAASAAEETPKRPEHAPENKSYEEMTVPELQAAILDKMRKNGPITPDMQRTVDENVYHDSLVNWVKSFR